MRFEEIFGKGAKVADGKLTIDLKALALANGSTTPPEPATPANILAQVLALTKKSTQEETRNPKCGVTVRQGVESIVDRGDESQLAIDMGVTFYMPNPSKGLDPSKVV